jgi:hypothetical protein
MADGSRQPLRVLKDESIRQSLVELTYEIESTFSTATLSTAYCHPPTAYSFCD